MKLKMLQRKFDNINQSVFDGELPKVRLALSSKITDAYGLCYFEWFVGQAANKVKITVFSETIARDYSSDDDDIINVLVHEMVHLWYVVTVGRNLGYVLNKVLGHDKEIFNTFGKLAQAEGFIKHWDLLA